MNPLGWGLALVVIVALGTVFGFFRATLAVVMFLALVIFGVRQMRAMIAAPPEPEVSDVSRYDLHYVCTMCGLRLKVEVAARDRAPSHCMEPMVLEGADGRPPIRPA